MKKFLSIIIALILLSAAAFTPVSGRIFTLKSFAEGDNLTQDGFTYSIINGEARIISFDFTGQNEITVPAVLGGYPVKRICDSAFYGNEDLEKITVSDGVEIIEEYAFSGIEKLKTAILPDSVTVMGSDVFSDCTALTSVRFSSGMTSIPESAFSYCSALTHFDIPESVTTIGEYAFYNSGLTGIEFPESVDCISYEAFGGTALTELTLPAKLKVVNDYSFSNCTMLKTINFSSGLERIRHAAFEGCESLESVILPDGIKVLGNSAFEDCTSLTQLYLPASLEDIGDDIVYATAIDDPSNYEDGVLYIGDCLAAVDDDLIGTACTVKPGTRIIASEAFYGCYDLSQLTLPDSLEYICDNPFYYCNSLKSITLPKNVKRADVTYTEGFYPSEINVSEENPYYCSVDGVLYNKDKTVLEAYPPLKEAEFLIIPEGVTRIADYAAANAQSLKTVSFPGSLDFIGECAFYASALTEVTIPGSVTEIAYSAFAECVSLEKLTADEGLVSIDAYAFNGCSALSEISLPSTIMKVENSAFDDTAYFNDKNNREDGVLYLGSVLLDVDNSKSGQLTVKEGTKVIAFRAVAYSQISSAVLPDGLLSICGYCFENCWNLNSLNIPDSVTYIGCDIICFIPLYQNSLNENGICIIDNCVVGSEDYYGECKIPEGTRIIAEEAFYESNISSVTVPESVIYIGASAFSLCHDLKTVNYNAVNALPALVSKNHLFTPFCYSEVENINIGENVEAIPDFTFGELGRLKEIRLPVTGTVDISENAFDPLNVEEYVFHDYYSDNYCGAPDFGSNTEFIIHKDTPMYEYAIASSIDFTPEEHNYGDYIYDYNATEEKDGTESRHCGICGKAITRTVPGTKIVFDEIVKSLGISDSKVIRGKSLDWTVITSINVTWLRFDGTYISEDGKTNKITTYYKYNSAADNITVTDKDGVRTWEISMKFTYTVPDDKVTESWCMSCRIGNGTTWYEYNETKPEITVGKTANSFTQATSAYAKYTLVSAAPAADSIKKTKYLNITVITTDDCDKVRIGLNGKYSTYQASSTNTLSCEIKDGLKTWVIKYKFSTVGKNDYTVQTRGAAWGEAKTLPITVI